MEQRKCTMEKLEIDKLFGGIYKNKRVLVTGHTGFKGSWLAYWLKQMGADVCGLALDPPTSPSHWELLTSDVSSHIQNINNPDSVSDILNKIKPEIIFHLAAQPLVRTSYQEPIDTFMTNIMGTANILEAARGLSGLKAVVVVTSDKCYDNKEWYWGYRENEAMGGKDPYSASKGCAELIVAAYRNSFLNGKNSPLIASARAGNVIGGGDWAADRIFTDIIKAASESSKVYLRSPQATRPWQFVLEPLSGYLALGRQLLLSKKAFAEAWNFGPDHENNVSVLKLVKEAKKHWKSINYDFDKGSHPPEAGFLMLDSSKAIKLLNWKPVWGFQRTVENTVLWYKSFYTNGNILTNHFLQEYISDAKKQNIEWSQT